MDINEALKLLRSHIIKANKKTEIRMYNGFIEVLTSLKDKNLTKDEFKSIEAELEKIALKSAIYTNKRGLSKEISRFKDYLNHNFSLVTEGYFTILGTAIGVAFGSTFGVVYGPIFGVEPGIQMALGTPFGLIIGLLVGIFLDYQADEQNRVLKVKS
ncbi:MAG: hypothetical protein AAFN93_06415 [Bacteroidota bacterium]